MDDFQLKDIMGIHIQEFVQKVMLFDQDTGTSYYHKFDSRYLMEYFDRPKLEAVEKLFNADNRRMGLAEFVRFFLNAIPHDPLETFYLTMALTDTFKEITLKCKSKEVTFLDLTNHFCDIITQKDTNIKVPIKLYPAEKLENSNLSSVREIDKRAPIIHERVAITLPKITVDKVRTDKTSHTSGPVKQVIYTPELNRVFALDTLSPSIKLFDTNLNFKRELVPLQNGKNIKDLAILSFAYSNKEQRLGCIIKDIGMSFWEASDNFVTEKRIVKNCGEKVYYFELFEEWVTTDKSFTHFWDIKEEKMKYSLQGVPGSSINSICEIPLLRVICVAYSGVETQKQLVLYQNFREIAKMPLGHAGCHTLHYNKITQTLLPIGYKITIPVYQIHPEYYDFTLLAELKGHTSLVTCITDVLNTTLVCTGDDIGCIRVWDLRTMKCVQVVKVARWLSYLLYIRDSKLIFTDSRVNLINFDKIKNGMSDKEPVHPLSAIFEPSSNTLIVPTSKQIRHYDIHTGELMEIFQVALEDELTVFKRLSENTFIAGSEQGKVKIYNCDGETISDMDGHSNQISDIQMDRNSKVFVTSSWDSDIHVWKQKGKDRVDEEKGGETKSHHILRSIRSNHFGKEVSLLQVSLFQNMIATGSIDSKVFLWDFEYTKLVIEVTLLASPTCLAFVDLYSLLLVGCSNGFTYIFRIERDEIRVSLRLLGYILSSADSSPNTMAQQREAKQREAKLMVQTQSATPEAISDSKNNLLVPSFLSVDIVGNGVNLYIGYSKGRVELYHLEKDSLGLEEAVSQAKKHNYTPFRTTVEDFNIEHPKGQFLVIDVASQLSELNNVEMFPSWSQQTHKDNINFMDILETSQRCLVTTSIDGYFKILSLEKGEIVGSTNINHALPIKWDMKLDPLKKAKERILLALQTIQLIFSKDHSKITSSENKKISIQKFIDRIKGASTISKLSVVKPRLFSDEYELGDLHPNCPKLKHTSTLKELQTYKRVYLNGSGFKRESLEEKGKVPKVPNHQRPDQKQQFQFLSPYYLPRLISKGSESPPEVDSQYMRSLATIFDTTINNHEDSSLSKKSPNSKNKNQFMDHARSKHYLSEESENLSGSVTQLLSELDSRKELSKRILHRGNRNNKNTLHSTKLSTHISQKY